MRRSYTFCDISAVYAELNFYVDVSTCFIDDNAKSNHINNKCNSNKNSNKNTHNINGNSDNDDA